MKRTLSWICLASVGLSAIATLPATAAPFGMKGNAVKVASDTPGEFIVYVGGLSGAEATISIANVTKTRKATANGCGMAKFSASDSWPTVKITSVNFATLPQRIFPKCSSAGVPEEPRTENFKTMAGEVILVGTPNADLTLTYAGSAEKKASVKGGVARFTKVVGNFAIGATQYVLSDIPTVPALESPIIKETTLFIPTSWQ
jgi:hypothetical protein